jgi:hypothetical protein
MVGYARNPSLEHRAQDFDSGSCASSEKLTVYREKRGAALLTNASEICNKSGIGDDQLFRRYIFSKHTLFFTSTRKKLFAKQNRGLVQKSVFSLFGGQCPLDGLKQKKPAASHGLGPTIHHVITTASSLRVCCVNSPTGGTVSGPTVF